MSKKDIKELTENQIELIIYNTDKGGGVSVKMSGDSVWLTQSQLAQLYAVSRPNIAMHIKNIFKDGELDEKVVCKIFLHTTQHGAIVKKTLQL